MKQLLGEAIEDYGRHRRSQGYAKNTLRVDTQVLRRFLAVNGNIYCHTIKDIHVQRHFEEASRTRTPSSLQTDRTVLRMFFDWLRHSRRAPADSDPMYGRRAPKVIKRERVRIPVSEFGRLLDLAGEREPRDRALIALMLYTLGRDSDVTSLRYSDLDLEGGWLKMYVQKTKVEDLMPVSEELDSEMRRWLRAYTENVGTIEPHYYLVPARRLAPIRGEEGRIVGHESHYNPEKRIAHASPIVKPTLSAWGLQLRDPSGRPLSEGAHTLRRSGARALFDTLVAEGYDGALRVVQSMLHHASITQTEGYIGITADRRTRDEIIRGRAMYGRPSDTNVLRLAE